KTAQVIGTIAKIADLNIRIFFYLTTNSNELQIQTKNRIEKGLPEFIVLDEDDCILFNNSMKCNRPVIIVLKKNDKILKRWRDHLINENYLWGYQSYIIDDEADSASLNTNKAKQTTKISTI